MKYSTVLLLLLLGVFAARSVAQNPPIQQRREKSEDRVIVTTNLVQVDAIVTDKSGQQVTDLRAEDFELLENGSPRQITGFSYIDLTSNQPSAATMSRPAAISAGKSEPPRTLHALRPESVRRAIAIVVDDFGLSFESIARLRSALERFIQERTLSTDFIAVIRASGGPGAMQQFTSNRAQILATIKRIRWYPTGRGNMSAIDSITPLDHDENGVDLRGYSANRPPDLSSKEFFGGSLGALGFVVEGLARFPGRKSIVLISEKLPVTTLEAQINGVAGALAKLAARANQYSIVISTMDARGLPKAGFTADDNQYNLAVNQIEKRVREGGIKFNVQQDALSYLAAQTGGMFVRNNNDLNEGLRRIVESEQGYYLLAYRPNDSDSEDRGRSYKVTLRLKRPELLLRSRSEFHRFTETREVVSAEKRKDDLLREALASPFVKEDARLKVTALFTGRSQIKILVHVDARDIVLTKSPQGSYNGFFDIAAVAFDDNGKVAQQVARTQILSGPSDSYERLLREGFVYTITLPMRKVGPYQVRVALRDVGSGQLGSDGQFIEVPDPKKTRLTVAGFIVHSTGQDVPKDLPERSTALGANEIVASGRDHVGRGPAVRRFTRGDILEYSYLVYGARLNDMTHSPNLLSQIRLFRKSEEVFTGGVAPVTIPNGSNNEGLLAGGRLKLGTGLSTGEYFMQITVTDKLAPLEKQSSEQWIDFEIVK
jgi:VWFA-related protein